MAGKTLTMFRKGRDELAKFLRPVSTAGEVAALLRNVNACSGSEYEVCISGAFDMLKSVSGASLDIKSLFEAIGRWALEVIDDKPIDIWRTGGGARRVVYSAAQCRGILANALLLNVVDTAAELKDSRHGGGLSLDRLLNSTNEVAVNKVACILNYFILAQKSEGSEDDAREIVVERLVAELGLEDFGRWAMEEGSQLAVCSAVDECDAAVLHDSGMEGIPDADSFVNFANANFGYGRFIASCTQEEIMQICCPEFNVGMLHIGMMDDSEVVVVSGVRRFSAYTGYAGSFKYAGPWEAMPDVQAILTMDATYSRHFSREMVLRDIRKAYLAFRGHRVVSTGRWGCGIFGGTPAHKFLQQLVAAKLAGSKIHFSCFGSPDGCDSVYRMVQEQRPTVAQLFQAILETQVKQPADFPAVFERQLKKACGTSSVFDRLPAWASALAKLLLALLPIIVAVIWAFTASGGRGAMLGSDW
eukprot:TRINITY_DN93238_c0_g1_i1.p1 TRINITY_DN93238_c0_g1~~TRINITY_DN93238_c0_g1_i1.p1  ORF type:complete len:490 (-),score=92.79 TRINITY_DN93238_c0_g1_i1:148-1566(-)